MMEKEYEQIEFVPGTNIDQAVNQLLLCHENGRSVCGSFNGVMLYSDTVTIEAAYKKITGKTKKEFDELLKL